MRAFRQRRETGGARRASAAPAARGGDGLSNQLLQRHAVGRDRAPEEGQADRIADRVVRGPGRERATSRITLSPGGSGSLFANRGRPLDDRARAQFDGQFAGLDAVRVHDDAEGALAATALGARAFTVGGDIAFGQGRYAPGTAEGNHLLAHELAHVAQGGETIRRAPLDGEQGEMPPIISLFTPGFWNDRLCGDRPCFREGMFEEWLRESNRQMIEDAAASVAPPVGEIGDFDVSIGGFSKRRDPDVSPAAPAAAATARVPTVAVPPLAENRIVAGGNDGTTVFRSVGMAIETEQPIVRLRGTTLAGAQEISLVAHANTETVKIGEIRMSPDTLADKLVEAGWRGKVVRLVACETGIEADGPSYAQRLANALARRGVESAVIAPVGDAVFGDGGSALPRVLPPGSAEIPEDLRKAGSGWQYAVADVPAGPEAGAVPKRLPLFHPGTWSGAGMAGAQMLASFAASYIHAQAVARRIEEQRAETGFAGWGGTGDRLYDLGAWLLDPTDEAGRSIPFDDRFDMPTWRRNIAKKCYAHPVGEELRMVWWTSDEPDFMGNPNFRPYFGIYKKLSDGTWITVGCEDCEGEDFVPDLEKVISPFVSDSALRIYLKLESMWA